MCVRGRRVNAATDFDLAKHVTHVHRHSAAPQVRQDSVFDSSFLRSYIASARQLQPYVPAELSEYVVGAYVRSGLPRVAACQAPLARQR